jgi:hypothetical protein
MSAESQDPGSVPLERDLERRFVAAPDLLHELLVAGEREQALGAEGREMNPRWDE